MSASPRHTTEVQSQKGLSSFGIATRTWFAEALGSPTLIQEKAWATINEGHNALIIAPTGSGKTLAAFLQSLDRLARRDDQSVRSNQPALVETPRKNAERRATSPAENSRTVKPDQGVRVLYISPLKALAIDVERNLQAPLRGLAETSARLGLSEPHVSVAVRSGDSTAADRRRIAAHPPDILITTPESLFLMLSSKVAGILRDVDTVIVDEVHALAGSKRGAHLAVSLERLAAMNRRGGFQRIGLSATVRPPERVAAFLGGTDDVRVVDSQEEKSWDLSVVVPVEDMTQPHASAKHSDSSHSASSALPDEETPAKPSMWPPVERRILDLILQHHSTICFIDSRQTAERLTAHLNELYARDLGAIDSPAKLPAHMMVVSAATKGRDGSEYPIIASAHHGSVGKQRRAHIEQQLKNGDLRCVVATSSLELGIDMGAVDLVIQVQAPFTVSSGLQRIGRAGHRIGETSRGIFFPTSQGDVLKSAVVAQRMLAGKIEEITRLQNPLDILAQHLVSMCVNGPQSIDDLYAIVRRCDCFRQLPRSAFDAVVDMLTGHYPSEDFAELRPRLTWDRQKNELSARPGARQLVTTSGGTIPDRGLFGVFLVGEHSDSSEKMPGRRVGELDEVMVYESRVGDVITLGTSSWRIEEITHSQVLVSPAPGLPGRVPFWQGDSMSRSLELGKAIGQTVRELGCDPTETSASKLACAGLDNWATKNLLSYIADQAEATGQLPDDQTIVMERFRDEIGNWRVCVHCAVGSAVLQPWALIIEQQACEHYGVDIHVTATNDGMIIQLPDVDNSIPSADLLSVSSQDARRLASDYVATSPLFAARFRECAARALLLPHRNPGQRSPLWQQRIKSSHLLSVASGYKDFPIVVEAMRECLQDVFNMDGLTELLADIEARRIRIVEVETEQPSPFARNLLFGYITEFVYDTDQPVVEQRLSALTLGSQMLAELMGTSPVEQLIEPQIVTELDKQLQCLAPDRRANNAEQLWDIIRKIGPLSTSECIERSFISETEINQNDAGNNRATFIKEWLAELSENKRIFSAYISGNSLWCVETDAGLIRDALNISVPDNFSHHYEIRDKSSCLRDLLLRWIKTHAVTTPAAAAQRFGLDEALVATHCDALVDEGIVVRDTFISTTQQAHQLQTGATGAQISTKQYCSKENLTRLKRRTLNLLRNQVKAVKQQQFARFLDAWHQMPPASAELDATSTPHNAPHMADLLDAIDMLVGYQLPASMLESVILPSRIPGYQPALLDEALATGQLAWLGHRQVGQRDGWISLWPADTQPQIAPSAPHSPALSSLAQLLLTQLGHGGAWRADDLAQQLSKDEPISSSAILDALWELAWAGLVASDTFTPVRDLCAGRGTLRTPSQPRLRHRSLRPRLARPARPVSAGGARWSLVSIMQPENPDRLVTALELEFARYGILTRDGVLSEDFTPSFADAYSLLSKMEEAGLVRRGYFISGLGGSQFATPGAVDLLRSAPPSPARLLAACDPLNPYGAALPWPHTNGHRPSRKVGALVVLDDGLPTCFIERGAHTLLTFEQSDAEQVSTAIDLVCQAIDEGQIGHITIERINDRPAFDAQALAKTLESAGFAMVPRGYIRRNQVKGDQLRK